MTTPIACQTCVHWNRHRETHCNWGKCRLVCQDSHRFGVYITPDNAEFTTLETFYCSNYQLRQPPQKFSVVDAAREAATKIGKEIK